jgi:hypothetical protein
MRLREIESRVQKAAPRVPQVSLAIPLVDPALLDGE